MFNISLNLSIQKGANNVSTTDSTDAESVIAELKASLSRIGMDCSQKGYALTSTTMMMCYLCLILFFTVID